MIKSDIRILPKECLMNKSNFFFVLFLLQKIGGFISEISFYLQGVHYHERMDRHRSMHRIHCCCSPGSFRNHPTLNKTSYFLVIFRIKITNFFSQKCPYPFSKVPVEIKGWGSSFSSIRIHQRDILSRPRTVLS